MKKTLLSALFNLAILSLFGQPSIISLTPSSAAAGSTVVIAGSGFSTTASENIVFFGATRAVIAAATATTLSVIVPAGATYQPVTVSTNNLVAYSPQPFTLIYATAGETFTPQSFSDPLRGDFVVSGYYATGKNISLCDLDGDKKADIIVSGESSSQPFYARNTSINNSIVAFGATKVIGTTVSSASGVAVSDFNGDGKPDLIATYASLNKVILYKNKSDSGTILFDTPVEYTTGTGSSPTSVAAQDLDADGKPDFIVVNNGTNTISIFRNTTSGTAFSFATTSYATAYSPYGVAAADLDADGKPDIAVTNSQSYGSISILKNNSTPGSIAMAAKKDYSCMSFPVSIAVGDLNEDGKPDLVVNASGDSTMAIFRNTNTGTDISFAPKLSLNVSNSPERVAIADMDGDAKPELIITNNNYKIAIKKNITTSNSISFGATITYPTFTSSSGVGIGDMDGDARPDIAYTIQGPYSNGGCAILRNQINTPVILSINPEEGGTGKVITAKGKTFTGITEVSFGVTPATAFSVVSDSVLTATVGTGSTGVVTIRSPLGMHIYTGFKYVPVRITTVVPLAGPVGSVVTLSGENFSPVATGNTVRFGAVKAVVTSASATTLTVLVPAGASYQPVSITTGGNTAYHNKPFTVTFPGATPSFTASTFQLQPGSMPVVASGNILNADMDGDGKIDLITTNYYTDSVEIFRNVSAGNRMIFAAKVKFLAGDRPTKMAIGDLDGDGRPDLVVINNEGYTITTNAVSLFKNLSTPGNIVLAPQLYLNTWYRPAIEVAIADFNRDGRPDIAAISNTSLSDIFRNTTQNGALSFTTQHIGIGLSPVGFAIADFNGDGKTDFAAIGLDHELSVNQNTSTYDSISFYPYQNSFSITPYSIATGDIDGDGKPDLAISHRDTGIVVFRNTTTGSAPTFAPPVNFRTSPWPYDLSLADLDGDGKVDMMNRVTSVAPYIGTLLKNTSTPGALSFQPRYTVSESVKAAADFDGDGKPDLIRPGTPIIIYKNKTDDPVEQQLCPPKANTFLVAEAAGNSYQWQVDTGTGFISITDDTSYTGSTADTLKIRNAPTAWYGYTYRCLVNGSNITRYQLKFSNTWIGTTGSTWENTANWSCGVLPDANTDVIISNKNVIVSSNNTVHTLNVYPGGSVTVKSGYTLTVLQ